jgi:hypothetical protein
MPAESVYIFILHSNCTTMPSKEDAVTAAAAAHHSQALNGGVEQLQRQHAREFVVGDPSATQQHTAEQHAG